mgnify:CR=1 FL=1
MSKIIKNKTELKIETADGKLFVDFRQGDNKKLLSSLEDNSISCIIQDEPYGKNSIPIDYNKFLACLLEGKDYQRGGKGICGNEWDSDIPPLSNRIELYRVSRPGGHVVAFTANEYLDLVIATYRKAGFEIVELISWIHGQGTPKIRNIDNQLLSDPDLAAFVGSRHGLAPAMEVALLARKPFSEKNVLENLKKHGTGLINVNGARFNAQNSSGYPKNVIIENSDIVKKSVGGMEDRFKKINQSPLDFEIVQALFFNKPTPKEKDLGLELENTPYKKMAMYNKNKVVNIKNVHDTVKPIGLMQYLVKMLTNEGDLVLDCFTGSGTTALACVLENRRFVGAELMPKYFDIASRKIANVFKQNQAGIFSSEAQRLKKLYEEKIKRAKTEIEKKRLKKEYQLKLQFVKHDINAAKKSA